MLIGRARSPLLTNGPGHRVRAEAGRVQLVVTCYNIKTYKIEPNMMCLLRELDHILAVASMSPRTKLQA